MPATTALTFQPERDRYGRATHRGIRDGRTVGVVVRLPRVYVEEFPERVYLVNDWTDQETAVTYHPTLKAAKAHLEEVAR